MRGHLVIVGGETIVSEDALKTLDVLPEFPAGVLCELGQRSTTAATSRRRISSFSYRVLLSVARALLC